MKSARTRTYVLAGVIGVLGLGVGAAIGPATAATGTTQTVTDRVSAIKGALSGLVKDKTLTQTQADKVATTLNDKLPRGGYRGPGEGGWQGGPGWHGGFGADLDAAAKAIGVTSAELRTAVQGGKSLAEVAKSKGVSQDTVVQALVTAEKARIAAAVKDGHLTQAQADAWTANLQAEVTQRVTATGPAWGRGHAGEGGPWSAPSTGAS